LSILLPLSFDQELTLVGKSLPFGEPCTWSLRLSGVFRVRRDRPSFLIQVARSGESPVIVPYEIRGSGLNVANCDVHRGHCQFIQLRLCMLYGERTSIGWAWYFGPFYGLWNWATASFYGWSWPRWVCSLFIRNQGP